MCSESSSIAVNFFKSKYLIIFFYILADCLMDRLVHELSLRIVDDYPASDPRWTDSVPAGHESAFATVSLLVLHQLEDKVKAHDLFLNFLRQVRLRL